MKLSFAKVILGVIMTLSLFGCGGNSSQDNNDNGNQQTENNDNRNQQTENNDNGNQQTENNNNGQIALKLEKRYSIPISYGDSNVLLDGDNLILAGGQTGTTTGATYDGSPLFSNKIIKWNMIDGTKQTLEMNATTGHPSGVDKGTGGRGNMTTIIYKLDDDKYLIAGGFQYVNSIEIADFSMESVKKITTLNDLTDSTGLNTTSFYVNNQGSALDSNGNIYWFGFNNGLYATDSIMRFNKTTETVELLTTKLTMPRESVFAYKLSNGKIILIGGWDGEAANTTSDSATRRAVIFDPETMTIERIADYPMPIHGHIGRVIDNGNKVCTFTGNITYQYSIQDNQWSTGCDLNDTSITNEDFSFPDGAYQGRYVGKLSNGQLVFINNRQYSSIFSDTINGYPLETNTTIDIYSIK